MEANDDPAITLFYFLHKKITMSGVKAARPILSRNHAEARRRVISLYRAWYRQLPFIPKEYGHSSVDLTVPVLYARLREEFRKNKDIKDLRIIDLLIHRWQNELLEVARMWKSDTHVMDFFREDYLPEKPKDFLDKFLSGKQ